MSLAIHEAALEAGIALTLLPVVYMQAGVDGSPLAGAQRRFALDPDGWARLAERAGRRSSPTTPTASSAWRCTRCARFRRRRSPPRWRRRGRSPGTCRSISISPSSPRRSATASSASAGGRWQLLTRGGRDRPALVPGPRHPPDRGGARRWSAERQAVIGLCPTHRGRSRRRHLPAGAPSGGWAAATASARTATWRPMPPPSCGCSSRASAWRICAGSRRRARTRRIAGRALWSSALLGGARAAGRPVGPHRAGLSRRSRGARPRSPQPVRPQRRSAARFAPVRAGQCRARRHGRRRTGACATATMPRRPPSHAPIGAPWRAFWPRREAAAVPGGASRERMVRRPGRSDRLRLESLRGRLASTVVHSGCPPAALARRSSRARSRASTAVARVLCPGHGRPTFPPEPCRQIGYGRMQPANVRKLTICGPCRQHGAAQ